MIQLPASQLTPTPDSVIAAAAAAPDPTATNLTLSSDTFGINLSSLYEARAATSEEIAQIPRLQETHAMFGVLALRDTSGFDRAALLKQMREGASIQIPLFHNLTLTGVVDVLTPGPDGTSGFSIGGTLTSGGNFVLGVNDNGTLDGMAWAPRFGRVIMQRYGNSTIVFAPHQAQWHPMSSSIESTDDGSTHPGVSPIATLEFR